MVYNEDIHLRQEFDKALLYFMTWTISTQPVFANEVQCTTTTGTETAMSLGQQRPILN